MASNAPLLPPSLREAFQQDEVPQLFVLLLAGGSEPEEQTDENWPAWDVNEQLDIFSQRHTPSEIAHVVASTHDDEGAEMLYRVLTNLTNMGMGYIDSGAPDNPALRWLETFLVAWLPRARETTRALLARSARGGLECLTWLLTLKSWLGEHAAVIGEPRLLGPSVLAEIHGVFAELGPDLRALLAHEDSELVARAVTLLREVEELSDAELRAILRREMLPRSVQARGLFWLKLSELTAPSPSQHVRRLWEEVERATKSTTSSSRALSPPDRSGQSSPGGSISGRLVLKRRAKRTSRSDRRPARTLHSLRALAMLSIAADLFTKRPLTRFV